MAAGQSVWVTVVNKNSRLKEKDQAFKDKDLKLVIKESLRIRTRTRTNIPAVSARTWAVA